MNGFLSLLLMMSLASVCSAETISLRADNWCPFNCEPKSERPGYMIEIAQKAFAEAGHQLDYQLLNWPRSIAEARAGKFSGVVGAAHSDVPEFIFPTESMGQANNCFFVKNASKWTYQNESSLETEVLGAIKEYSYGEPVDSYIKKHAQDSKRIDLVAGDNPLELNIKKLEKGRITTLIEEANVLKNFLFRSSSGVGVKSVGCVKQDSLFIAFNPKHPRAKEYANLLSAQVLKMRKDGALAKLLALYGLNDWK